MFVMKSRMPKSTTVLALLAAPLLVLLASCEKTEESLVPSRIIRVSGNDQYSKSGTQLPEPLVVQVQYSDFTPASGVAVRFRSVEGGGTVSSSIRPTDDIGQASITFTLGAAVGPNRIRAELADDSGKFIEFTETAGEFYCLEENPEFERKFNSIGQFTPDLFLFTHESRLHISTNGTTAGIVRLTEAGGLQTRSFIEYEEGFGRKVVHDCAFSHNGDFYLAWRDYVAEVMKVNPNKSTVHFASLETLALAEITTSVAGVLAGCDEFGPFVVGCRDTVLRFEEALYSGVPGDEANTDAVAVDTNSQNANYEDIFFIDMSDNTLRRLPLDSLTATGPTVVVTSLTADEATYARGMVCNEDGTIFVLVDDEDDTKVILRVTTAGVKTVEYDFFDREPETPAGVMSDLAIRPGATPILYTIDTFNDMLLRYSTNSQILTEFFPDTTAGYDPESISRADSYGERVGLVLLP